MVFIGKNCSGKTNLLEALTFLFKDFNVLQTESGEKLQDFLWFDRDTSNSIVFDVELSINDFDIENMFEKLPIEELEQFKQTENLYQIRIMRKISSPEFNWYTELFKWGNLTIIKENTFCSIEVMTKEITTDIVEHIREILEKTVFNESSDKTHRTEEVDSENDESIHTKIVTNINYWLSDWVVYISPARDEKTPFSPDRPLILDSNTAKELQKIGLSMKRKNGKRWSIIKGKYREIVKKELNVLPTGLIIDEKDMRVPIKHLGAGNQEIIKILSEIFTLDYNAIIAIEEPELHLHPGLARRLFNLFRKVLEDHQLLISTHSPIFVDKQDLANTYLVRLENKRTKISRIDESNLKEILSELGQMPSDIFFADRLIFVEGPTEKEFLPKFAKKIGFDFDNHGIVVFPMRGSGQTKYHLEMWLNIARKTSIPFFVMLDNNANDIVQKLEQKGVLNENQFHLLTKGDIEDYYPHNLIIDCLKQRYSIKFDDLTDLQKKSFDNPQSMVKSIEKLLRSKKVIHQGWKPTFGKFIGENIKKKDIDRELVFFLQEIQSSFEM